MRSPRSDRAFGHLTVYEELLLKESGSRDDNPLHSNTDEFKAKLLDICGDVRLLWFPDLTGTTVVDASRVAATITYSKEVGDFDDPPAALGNGVAVQFDGVDEEADTPDVAGLSFGDGANDNPFSVVALVNQDVVGAEVIIAKEASSSDEEWTFEVDSSGNPQFVLTDESASATIGRQDATALSSTIALISGTYDGAGLASGISIYLNGLATDDTDVVANSYVAMEAGASTVQIAHHYATPALFWDGKIAFALVTGKELTADEQWAIKTLVNGYYSLSL